MSYACGRQRGCGLAGKRNLPPAGHLMDRTENERFGVKDFFEFPTRYEANHRRPEAGHPEPTPNDSWIEKIKSQCGFDSTH
jgi:hypothetical protein